MNGPEKPIGATDSQAFWDQTLGAAPESPKNEDSEISVRKNFGGVPYVTQWACAEARAQHPFSKFL